MNTVMLQWVLSQGPPWADRADGSDQIFLLLIVILGVAVLILFAIVLSLWSRQSGTDESTSPQTDTANTETVSEYEQIRQIDATVEGQLPQQEIVKQTDWSEAKVSRVVSRLAENGQLKKVQIGRRNFIQVINSEESEPTEAGDTP